MWFAFFGDAHYRQDYRDMVKTFDHERTGAIAKLSAELKKVGGYSAADPAQSIESQTDGLWLALLLYPGRISRESAREQTIVLLATHFPRHFGSRAVDQCARLR